jgi:iron(III) transport system substrate-binding protein
MCKTQYSRTRPVGGCRPARSAIVPFIAAPRHHSGQSMSKQRSSSGGSPDSSAIQRTWTSHLVRTLSRHTRSAFLCLHFLGLASAADDPAARNIYLYDGADRAQRLIAGAKKEASLNLYCVMGQEQIGVLAQAFEQKYGVNVNVWRSSSENVLQRTLAEEQGKRSGVDVLELGAPELEALRRERLLQEVRSPYFQDLMPEVVPVHREWVGNRINVYVHAYNTNLVRKAELPKTYQELLEPKWKGRLSVESANLDWFSTLVREFGEEKGLQFFRELVAANGLSVRKGHPAMVSLVASGEIPLALATYGYFVDKLKKEKSAPIDWFITPPAIVRVTGVGIVKQAPHPHAAVLFYDFMLSEAQPMLAEFHITPASKKLSALPGGVPVRFVDPGLFLDEQSKWTKLYEQMVLRSAIK